MDFSRKLRAAWQIFFPPPPAVTTPKEEGKNRLRMILVADRRACLKTHMFLTCNIQACCAVLRQNLLGHACTQTGSSVSAPGAHRLSVCACRCGMNAASLFEMKHSIVRAVSEYVDIEAEELVDVNVTMDSDLGTIYSVAVPVRRVKPVAQVPMSDIEAEGITLTWEPEDENADPSVRFPYGT